MRKFLFWIGVLLIIGIAAFFGLKYLKTNTSKAASQSKSITFSERMVYEVKRGDFQKTISSLGYLEPKVSKDLYFSVSGIVDEIYVSEGDHVERGDRIAHIDDKKYRLDYLIAKNDYDQVKINGSEKEREERRLKLEVAEDNLRATTLFAPFSGVITEVYVDVGDPISTNKAIVHIVDDSTYTIEVNVNETDIRFVNLGQDAVITMDAFPSLKFRGRVTGISYETKNSSGVVIVPVTVELLDKNREFKPGLSADVDIITQLEKDKIIIPQTAILNMGKRSIVLKIVDGKPTPKPVKVKATNGIYALIERGLKEGDKIIVNVAKFKEGFSPGGIMGQDGRKPNMNFRMMKNFR